MFGDYMKLTIDYEALNDSGQCIEIDDNSEITLPVKNAENEEFTAIFTMTHIWARK